MPLSPLTKPAASAPATTKAMSTSGGNSTASACCGEGLDAGDGAAEDQRMDVVRALVGVDRLEVHGVADHVILVGDTVAAVHVARDAGDIERLAAIVELDQ